MRGLIFALFLLVSLISCGAGTASTGGEKSCCASHSKGDDVVEVLYMHGKQRCVTCVAIGTEAAKLVNELGSDRVVMKSIDFSTSEGEKIADSYEIASSSIIVVRNGKVDNLTGVGFKYAKSNPELFRKRLKESIQKMME